MGEKTDAVSEEQAPQNRAVAIIVTGETVILQPNFTVNPGDVLTVRLVSGVQSVQQPVGA